jgi:integrase/recombinase XerD
LIGAADERVRALRALFKWGKLKRKDIVTVNLAQDVAYLNKKSEGHHTWTPEEFEQYEQHHSIGTKARLALDLIQYLGVSRMDVVKIGPRNISERLNKRGEPVKVFSYQRQKTKIDGTIGMAPALLASITACPMVGSSTFLVNDYGRPFTVGGFRNRLKKWVREAGLPEHCSAHGIRKAAAVRAAENGATPMNKWRCLPGSR